MNKNVIDWEKYANSFETFDEEIFNEFEDDLHSMKMNKSLFKKTFQSPKYVEIAGKICVSFDQTNSDLFSYEKELNLGETN